MNKPPSRDPENQEPSDGDSPQGLYSVQDILKDNLARQLEHEKPIVEDRRKRRKLRDYLICMILVNALLSLPAVLLHNNVVVLVYSFAGIVIFSSGFTWIMWKVMGDY